MDIREQLVHEMTETDAPPLGSLVADAEASGVRARRRRHGLLGGAAATAAVIAIFGVAAVIHASPGVAGGSPIQAGAPSGIAAASPMPTAKQPSPSADPVRYAAGKPVVKLLQHLVAPHGHFTEVSYDEGSFLYNDGHGAATISAHVVDAPSDYGPSVQGMACPAFGGSVTCEVRELSGGAVARIMTMGPDQCSEAKCSIEDRRVEIMRTDGVYVTVDAYNGPFGHGRAATRTHTILTTAQLLAIATNSHWSLDMS